MVIRGTRVNPCSQVDDVHSRGKKRESGLHILKVSSIPAFLFPTWNLQFINKFLLLCRGNLCPEMDMELNIIFQGPLIFHWTCDKIVSLRGISVKIVSSQLAEECGSLSAVGIIPPRFTETQTHTSLCKQAVVNYCDMLRQVLCAPRWGQGVSLQIPSCLWLGCT